MSRFDSLELGDRAERDRQGKPGEARAPTGTPARGADYFEELADKEFRERQLASALTDYSRALECDARRFPCWLAQVKILIELGEYKEGALWADKALELFPEHPELLAAKAVAATRTGLLDKALAYSDNALSQKGATPYVWVCRGEVLLARGSRMAEHCFARALAQCADNIGRAWVRLELARLLRRHRRFSTALAHAVEAVQTLAGQSSAWLELGLCQAALGLRDAEASLEQALQLNRASVEADSALTRLRCATAGEWLRGFFRRLLRR